MVSASADPFALYRRVGWALAALILLMALVEFAWNWVQPTSRDFISFWGASQFGWAGQAELAYDNAALQAVQSRVVTLPPGAEMPFAYPPFLLLLVMPFGLGSYPLGLVLWSFAGYALYLGAANRLYPGLAWAAAAFPPVFACAALGQTGFVMAAIFLAGLSLLPTRSFLAGLVLGCLILKPQLSLMLPIAMLAARQWRTIAGAALSSAAVLILGLAAFGPGATWAWLNQMPLYAEIARNGLVGWHKLVSIYAAGRQIGLPELPAMLVHGVVNILVAIAVWRIWRSHAGWPAKFAILAPATMLASPYLYVYDALILLPAFVYVARRGAPAWLVALAWLLPIVTMIQVASGAWPVNIGPLSALVVMVLVWRATREEEHLVGN